MSLYTVYFSPTGNTQKSVKAMAEAITMDYQVYDCTCPENGQEVVFNEEDFVIFGGPVYAGRIPEVAMERLRKFKGNQTPCVVVATYGNRHYDDALLELKDMAESNGFIVKGGAALIGRHTFGQIEVDRPNEDDLAQMKEFAIKAYENTNCEVNIPGNPSYREGGKGGKFRPQTTDACVKCGLCKRNCPVGAIDDNFQVIDEACISCFRCIRNCPLKAKVMNTESYLQFAEDFTKKLSARRENEFYL